MYKISLLSIACILMLSCLAGGISQFHNPEENILIDDNYIIRLRLGAPGGNAEKGFVSASIIINEKELAMNRIAKSKEYVEYEYKITYSEIKGKIPVYKFKYIGNNSGSHIFIPHTPKEPVK